MDYGFHQKLQMILNVKWEHEAQKSWLKCNKVSLFTQNQANPRNKKAPNPNINIIFPTILPAPCTDFASCFTGSPWRQWPDRWVATSNLCPRALGLNSSAQWPWRWDGFLWLLRQLPPSFLNAEMECKNVRFGKKNSEVSVETVGYCLWGSKIPLLLLKNSGVWV